MIVAVCIDDRQGMLFNSRRQSRDRILIDDLMNSAADGNVYIRSFSEKLFAEKDVIVDNDCLENAGEKDLCFVEDTGLIPYSAKIATLIIYKWNTVYPADFHFEMPEGFTLASVSEFAGSSHNKITKEVYVNERKE